MVGCHGSAPGRRSHAGGHRHLERRESSGQVHDRAAPRRHGSPGSGYPRARRKGVGGADGAGVVDLTCGGFYLENLADHDRH